MLVHYMYSSSQLSVPPSCPSIVHAGISITHIPPHVPCSVLITMFVTYVYAVAWLDGASGRGVTSSYKPVFGRWTWSLRVNAIQLKSVNS